MNAVLSTKTALNMARPAPALATLTLRYHLDPSLGVHKIPLRSESNKTPVRVKEAVKP